MANALTIDSNFGSVIKALEQLKKDAKTVIDVELTDGATNISTKAKQNLVRSYPEGAYDTGNLANSISFTNEVLEKHITVNAFYAAFVEFGTGHYAAQYVSTLPDTWRQYAQQYKGQKGGGDFHQFVNNILDWVIRKGFAARYSVKTQRRQKADKNEINRAIEIAYLIAHKILKNGTRPHPFIFPAFEREQPIILKNIEQAIKNLLS